ncbi:MAG: hypothetical protein LBC48_01615, partial [Dysgonamonadaceae bacterium]|nr:hypothetical protein [Dysgonamonadaceae bacterium]
QFPIFVANCPKNSIPCSQNEQQTQPVMKARVRQVSSQRKDMEKNYLLGLIFQKRHLMFL